MNAFLFLSDTTQQHSRLTDYDEQGYDTVVAQQYGRGMERDAQCLFGVGFAGMPVENDRLLVVELNSQLYAIGGSTQALEASLGLVPGARAVYSTDTSGALQALLRLGADKTAHLDADTTDITGAVNVAGASDFVALAAKVDTLWSTLYQMFSTWVPVAQDGGAALKTAFTAAFPSAPESVAATKLKTE